MKTKTLNLDETKPVVRTTSETADVDESFERDWENGLSSEEFWGKVRQHIIKLYASRPKK